MCTGVLPAWMSVHQMLREARRGSQIHLELEL